jgi:ParB family transcriptional regulator, chromosome partitioning protein
VVRQSGLGKGLGALIPTNDDRPATPPLTGAASAAVPAGEGRVASEGEGVLAELPLQSVVPSRFQTREIFDEAALDDLAASIKEVGVLQPILVRPSSNNSYELVAGERRWRAARRAGLSTIPAIIKETPDRASVLHVLVENLQREDLDPLEEAAGFQQLVAELGATHEEVAARVGRSRSAVTNSLRLLQLTPAIQKMIKTKELSAGHARTLLQVTDKAFQESLARRAVAEGMTVRQVEAAIQLRSDLAAGKSGKQKQNSNGAPKTDKPAALLELEEILAGQFDTRVSIDLGPKNGRIVVEFADIEDLERIFAAMTNDVAIDEADDGAEPRDEEDDSEE